MTDPAALSDERRRSFLDAYRREYALQVRWFLLARALMFVVCLAILLIYEEGFPRVFAGAYATLVAALALAALHLLAFRFTDNVERLAGAAVIVDVLVATAIAYQTGGIYNIGFTFLYFAAILSAVVLISDGAGFIVASSATVALAGITAIYGLAATGTLPNPPLLGSHFYEEVIRNMRAGRVTANLIGIILAFHGVAFLGSRLPRRSSHAQVLYDEVVEGMAEGVVAIDRRGRILLANAEARRLLNWTNAGPLVGRRFADVLRRREDTQVLDVLASGEEGQRALELEIRDRGVVPVEVATTVLREDERLDARVRAVVGIFRDVTLRNHVEEIEARLARLLDVEQIALGIAHEIRNPLGSIRGAVQELSRHAFDDPSDLKLAQIVLRESERLDRILQEFLDFARMRPPVHQRIDLGELVDETMSLLAKRSDAAGLTLEREVERGLFVNGDRDQLHQAFLNIGLNAIDAIGGKPGRLRVKVTAGTLPRRGQRASDRHAAANVTLDNDGPVLAPADLKQIFMPFFTSKKKGLGLGLAITQKIARQHDGDVSCEAGEMGGACFRVRIPLVQGADAP